MSSTQPTAPNGSRHPSTSSKSAPRPAHQSTRPAPAQAGGASEQDDCGSTLIRALADPIPHSLACLSATVELDEPTATDSASRPSQRVPVYHSAQPAQPSGAQPASPNQSPLFSPNQYSSAYRVNHPPAFAQPQYAPFLTAPDGPDFLTQFRQMVSDASLTCLNCRAELIESCSEQTEENTRIKERWGRVVEANTQLGHEKAALQAELANVRAELAAKQGELAVARDEIAQFNPLKGKMDALLTKADEALTLSSEMRAAEAKVAKLEGEVAAGAERAAALESENATLTDKSAKLEAELDKVQSAAIVSP